MKNVLAIHDISCVGRCSLTVALPVISGLGTTCSLLPTALLSTHTGGFSGFTYLDLTEEMTKILDAWRPLKLRFDSVYSGFLASPQQIDIVKRAVDEYRTGDCFSVIDPVMADDGQLYKIFDMEFVKKMAELVPYADVLIPNITEACLLCGVDYVEGAYSEQFVEGLLRSLQKMGARQVVLTGVYFDEDRLGVAIIDREGKISYAFCQRIMDSFHGTGDLFGSVLTACLCKGMTLHDSAQRSAEFVVKSILATDKSVDKRYGVDFEAVLCDS